MKPGKYDPPDKERIMRENLNVCYLWQVIDSYQKPQFTPFPSVEDDASREKTEVTSTFQNQQTNSMKRGRKTVVTNNQILFICKTISEGATEKGACLQAAISVTAWNKAKKRCPEIRSKITEARKKAAELKYKQYQLARYESQIFRLAGKKAKRPQPTHQANLVMWHLIYRVPLNFTAIPQEEIQKACEQFNYTVGQWQRQATVFGLWDKIYAKRAKIRGDELLKQQSPRVFLNAPQSEDDDSDYGGYNPGW